jgi:signal transduction histidine kinase
MPTPQATSAEQDESMRAEPVQADRRRGLTATISLALLLAIGGSLVAAWVDASTPAYSTGEALTATVTTIVAVIGAVVVLSTPRNPIGWLILGLAISSGLGEALTEAGVHDQLAHPGPGRGSAWLVMFGVMLRSLSALIGIAAIPAYFPDGRLPGRRWRWVAFTLMAGLTFTVLASTLGPIETRLGDHWRGPLTPIPDPSNSPLEALNLLASLTILIAAIGALGGIIARWRRGDQVVRQQLLLFLTAVGVEVSFLAAVLVYVTATPNSPPRWAFALLNLPLPIAIATATLNHGLYELRRAANQALLWFLTTITVSVLYVVIVVAATALAPDRSSLWPPALAATIAAASLIPARDRFSRVVTRVIYGRWHEPYEVLSRLGQRLEAASDIDRLLNEAVEELRNELDLDEISVRDPTGRLVAGARSTTTSEIALISYGTTVGSLSYTSHRNLSEPELRLIHDLARQLGDALHARALAGDLQRTRERLVLSREEERRRLRRDLHDGIGPALAGLTLKAETAKALLPPGAENASAQLEVLSEEIRATVGDVRHVVEGLRPPALDELGLMGACDQAISRLAAGSGVRARLDGEPQHGLPAAVEVAAFRIVQEAATNVVRHAQAQSLVVSIRMENASLLVSICDDGAGLQTARHGNGMSTMRERAEELGGHFAITSTPSGVVVEATIPCAASHPTFARTERHR